MQARDRDKLKKLHAKLLGSDNPAERENARAELGKLLARHKKTWNDVPELLQSEVETPQQDDDEPSGDAVASNRPASLTLSGTSSSGTCTSQSISSPR
jgi:hypothetical protein